jgi:hypothetical protein
LAWLPRHRTPRGPAESGRPSSSIAERGANGRDVRIEALRQLVRAKTQRRHRQRHVDRFDNLVGGHRLFHVADVEVFHRQRPRALALRSVTEAPRAINPGIESPIGEPFATLPPIVPALRIGGDAKRSHISFNSG